MHWDAQTYDREFSFVANRGRAVIDLLDLEHGATVLDLGCGTGTLTQALAEMGWKPIGLDQSTEQLTQARTSYPNLTFIQSNAYSFELDESVDAVFSNAMLHWVPREQQPAMLACVARALKPGGQFVFECGGFGNNARTHKALAQTFSAHGLSYDIPFYFPTIAEYAGLLDTAGLDTTFATLFDRPTPLDGGPDGMRDWLTMFIQKPFEGMDEAMRAAIISDTIELLRAELQNKNGSWTSDYVRLRMRAIKRV